MVTADVLSVVTFLKALSNANLTVSGSVSSTGGTTDIKGLIVTDIGYAIQILEELKAQPDPLPAPLDKIKADADKIETALKLFQFFVNLYPTTALTT